MQEFGNDFHDEEHWRKIEQEAWRQLPSEQKAQYREPWVMKLDYEEKEDLMLKTGAVTFMVAGIEDRPIEGIEKVLQKAVKENFPHVFSFTKDSIAKEVAGGNPGSRISAPCNHLKDICGSHAGLYFLWDYTRNEPRGFLNEYGDRNDIWRGYGFHLSINANSKEAGTYIKQITHKLDIRLSQENQEYLQFMEEANIGMPGKQCAKERRKEAILMEMIRANYLERMVIMLTRGRYLGRGISKEKLRSILYIPPVKNY